MIPVILSGGSGTRLWPVSRARFPKQFCELFDEALQSKTYSRLNRIGHPWIITSDQLKNLTEGLLRKIQQPTNQIVYEPSGKNTAPAIALICKVMQLQGKENEILGIFPSDHLIQKENEFLQTVAFAEQFARQGQIVTLGIKPHYPETGYGYIQMSPQPLEQKGELTAHSVVQFHEKPDLARAKKFVSSNFYCWNAGIFIFKVSTMIQAFEKHAPAIWDCFSSLNKNAVGSSGVEPQHLLEIYARVENKSIDYAILEKLGPKELCCVPADIGWSDVGSWDSYFQVRDPQPENLCPIEIGSQNCDVFAVPGKKYALIDVDDLMIVDTPDALLAIKKGSSQKVKDVVDLLKAQNSTLVTDHPFEFRPWGYFEILKNTETFKSKVIQVLPGSQISYQSHQKRAEHWVITKGTGEVVLNEDVIPVKSGSHVYIPVQAKHRIRNNSSEVLEFVEVQLGSYFGEDDIVRYQDDYKRK